MKRKPCKIKRSLGFFYDIYMLAWHCRTGGENLDRPSWSSISSSSLGSLLVQCIQSSKTRKLQLPLEGHLQQYRSSAVYYEQPRWLRFCLGAVHTSFLSGLLGVYSNRWHWQLDICWKTHQWHHRLINALAYKYMSSVKWFNTTQICVAWTIYIYFCG